ncbi:hypothetical protein EG328_008652 [Venturia inaequalis]|uniref:Uncharacterized protein n=1 Tax=Venturia inaequalis TaxID=5025 RepID=A0A8H3V8K2_VENIN|nr:hypothetical protein EG328_008652 [Venturia inaequalis]KAE9984479.1 hypothetical protein EG327_005008 [Venturia inaequalis]RDI85384.1 hypothetical protein Vi05172_g4582 [Venturia inaequalis]
MAAPRTTSLRALSKLTAATTPRNTTRSLHMTGPSSSSPTLTTTRPSRAAVATAIDNAKKRVPLEPTGRTFNTSRTLKAVNDTSTIDFAYLPDFDPDSKSAPAASVRVPLLPPSLYPASTKTSYTKAEEEIVMGVRSEVNVMSGGGEGNVSVLSNVGDAGFEGVRSTGASVGRKVSGEVGELRRIWAGFVDDVLGVKTKTA